jgi:hypothetical protein
MLVGFSIFDFLEEQQIYLYNSLTKRYCSGDCPRLETVYPRHFQLLYKTAYDRLSSMKQVLRIIATVLFPVFVSHDHIVVSLLMTVPLLFQEYELYNLVTM